MKTQNPVLIKMNLETSEITIGVEVQKTTVLDTKEEIIGVVRQGIKFI